MSRKALINLKYLTKYSHVIEGYPVNNHKILSFKRPVSWELGFHGGSRMDN